MQHEVKSQDDMNKIEQHSTDVLIKAIEECEKLKKENRELRGAIKAIEIICANVMEKIHE